MALIKCPECNKEISDSVDVCVHCGYKINNKKLSIKDYLKFGIPMILVFVLKKPILFFYYYLVKFLGLNTSSKIVGTYLYSIFHIGIMIIIFYLIYTKCLKIKDKMMIIISLFIVALLTSMTVFIIPNTSNSTQSSNETNIDDTNDDELISCSNKGYFIGQLQADLYNSYGGYDDIVITGCSTSYAWEQLQVSCNFKYRVNSGMKYKTGTHWKRYDCKK